MPGKILITGGSGLISTRLSEVLIDQGYEVGHLSRHTDKFTHYKTFKWDIAHAQIDDSAITWADYIIHLAGTNVTSAKWTEEHKQNIYNSRINSTNLIHNCLRNTNHHVKGFVSASAIGIYGDSGDQLMSEESLSADDFLASVCKDWEAAAWKIKDLGIRTVIYRIGIVLSDKGGKMPQMARSIKMMAGAPLGSGKQYMSWIHIDDLCRLFINAIEDPKFEGVYNAVAPHPVTNKKFIEELASVLNKPLVLPNLPAFAVNLVLGQKSEAILASQRVSANKLMQTGFTFEYNHLDEALNSFYKPEE